MTITRVRQARLLDRNLKEKSRLNVKSQSVSLQMTPLSTASVALCERSEAMVKDYVELFTARGSAGIFRITGKESGYGTGGDSLSLEHGICVLGDAATPEGERATTDNPDAGKLKGTYRDVLNTLLSFQTAKIGGVAMWTLGVVEIPDTETVTYEYDGGQVLHAILDVLGTIDGYALSFNQSAFPWVMHVKAMEDTPSCEGRLTRNVNTARVMLDISELCTRVECKRLTGGHMQLEDEPQWGIVSKRLTFADELPLEIVERECRMYLEAHHKPRVSIEIDGLDLAAITNEPLDRIDCGRMMRLALPEYGLTVNERVISVEYVAAVSRPEQVTVALSTTVRDASAGLSELTGSVDKLKNTSTGYGNRISNSETNITNLKDAAEGFAEIDGKITHWFNGVEVDLNAEEAQLGLMASREEVTANSDKISEAFLILDGDTDIGGSHVGLVSRVGDAEANIAENTKDIEWVSEAHLNLETTYNHAYAELSAKVGENEASISTTATQLGSRIDLKADKTYVDNLIVEEIDAVYADINYTISNSISTKALTVNGDAWVNGTMTASDVSAGSITLGGTKLKLITKSLLNGNTTISVNASGGVVTGVTLNRKYTEFHFLGYE